MISPVNEKEKPGQITIQLVNSEEVALLASLARRTFVDAFGRYNNEADMDHYLNDRLSIPAMNKELHTESSFFYFARIATTIVGYLKINIDEAQNEPMGSDGLEIERIYIDEPYQGKGIGQELIRFTEQKASEWGKNTLWLGVWDRNPGAIKLYERNGFVPFGSHDFQLGEDLQTDILMKRELGSKDDQMDKKQ